MIVHRQVAFVRRPNRTKAIVPAVDVTPSPPAGRVPRISRLMALAIEFDRMIREGEIRDQSEAARIGHVTQPRATQIMALNLLAPDIQESLLFLPRTSAGRDPITERDLRPVVAELNWRAQRALFSAFQRERAKSPD